MPVLHTYSFSSIYIVILLVLQQYIIYSVYLIVQIFQTSWGVFFKIMEKREIVSNISYVETFELKQQNTCYLVNIIELLIVLLDSICRHIVYTVKY